MKHTIDTGISYYARTNYKEKSYISSLRHNGLYELDDNGGTLIGKFEGEDEDAIALHNMAVTVGGEIWLLPLFKNRIDVVDMHEKKMLSYFVWPWESYRKPYACAGCIIIENTMVIIPEDIEREAVSVDIQTKKMLPIGLIKRVRESIGDIKGIKGISVCGYDDNTILYFGGTSLFVEVSKNLDIIVHKVDDNIKIKRIGVCEDGILICTHDKLYKWDNKEGREAVLMEFDMKIDESAFMEMVENEQKICILDGVCDRLLVINKLDYSQRIVELPICQNTKHSDVDNWAHYAKMFITDEKLIIAPLGSLYEIEYDFQSNKLMKRIIDRSECNTEKKIENCVSNQNRLRDFIEYVESL